MRLMGKKRRLGLSDRKLLLKNQNNKCFYCEKNLKSSLRGDKDDFNRSPDWACVDHKIPFCDGGNTDLKNCVMSCRSCNLTKGVSHYKEKKGCHAYTHDKA